MKTKEQQIIELLTPELDAVVAVLKSQGISIHCSDIQIRLEVVGNERKFSISSYLNFERLSSETFEGLAGIIRTFNPAAAKLKAAQAELDKARAKVAELEKTIPLPAAAQ